MKKFLLFAAACVALVACKNDENIITNEPAEPGQTITLHATASMGNKGGAHKIAPNDITAGSVAFHWEEGDQVILYTMTYHEMGWPTGVSEMQVFTVKPGTINGAEADFTGTALSDMSNYSVYYVGKDVWTKEQLADYLVNGELLPFNYYPGSTNWFFSGSGNADGFSLQAQAVIRMQLKGDVKLGKVVFKTNSSFSETLNFIHHEYTGLQLSATDAVDLTIPTAGRGGENSGIKLSFYDTAGDLIMEKSSDKNIGTNINNHELINVGEITVAAAPSHVAVDLGLSVKWATCNIGASSPEQYGLYFAWGETVGYANASTRSFDWASYKWMKTGGDYCGMINKYTRADGQTFGCWYSSGSFVGDGKTVLDAEDDAATVNWGSGWRIPTTNEMNELKTNCNAAWTANYNSTGVAGYVLTSTKNGNSIFLPAAGMYNQPKVLQNAGKGGYYWSSSLSGDSDIAMHLNFSSSPSNAVLVASTYGSREKGLTIRPVKD